MAKIPACDWPMRSRSRKSASKPGRVEDARLRERLGGAARLLARGLDHAHARSLGQQHARDRRADAAGTEDDDVADSAARGPAGARSRLFAARGDPITTIRSPVAIASSPPGRIVSSPRMIAATFESSGIVGVAERDRRARGRRVVVDVELADLHLAVGEHVGLAGGRHAEDAADRVRGLELGGDDEVDVELALAPELDVLDARRADHGRRAARPRAAANMPATRFTSSRDVQAMTRSAVADPGGREVLAGSSRRPRRRRRRSGSSAPAAATPRCRAR